MPTVILPKTGTVRKPCLPLFLPKTGTVRKPCLPLFYRKPARLGNRAYRKPARLGNRAYRYFYRKPARLGNRAYPGPWKKARSKTAPSLPIADSHLLFQNNHFPHRRNLVRLQLVEIDTTRNTFTERIPTIPIRRTTPARVVTR